MSSKTPDIGWDELDELYREVILDHYRSPRNPVPLEAPDIESEGFNPFCGDQIVVQLKLDGDGRVAQTSSRGEGCSISLASVSMMTELLKGKTLNESEELRERFRALMMGEELSEEILLSMGDLEALQGVRKFPIRIKCALLAWSALQDGINEYRAQGSAQ